MKIIKRLRGMLLKSLSAPTDIEQRIMGIRTAAAGITVTPRNAMEVAAVRCAVQVISEAIGQLPVHVYKRNADGSKERTSEHPAQALLHDQVCDWVSAGEFRELITRDALLWGDGFAFILRDSDGIPVELHRLAPDHMKVETDEATKEPVYIFAHDGKSEEYAFGDIIHIRAPSMDGVVGLSPVDAAREAISLSLVMERYAGTLFKNGGRPSLVITLQGDLGDTPAETFAKSWADTYADDGNGGVAILENGAKAEPLSMNSTDAQFLEMRRFAIEEISRVYRVPPIFLSDFGRATWSNNEAQGSQLVSFCLMAWIKRWEGEIRLKLIAQKDRKDFYAEFLTDDLLRADTQKRMTAYGVAITNRIMSPNEARAKENLPPYAGGNTYENPNTTASPAPETEPEKEQE